MKSSEDPTTFDTLIVGGGAAGLTAALVLVRAHNCVLVVDAGEQSNLVSSETHGVFTRDKTSPKELCAIAREQLLEYPSVTLMYSSVTEITKDKDFQVVLKDMSSVTSKTILLAQGVTYKLPDIEGITKLWGNKVWYCPYCDGYEASNKKLLAIGGSDWITHMKEILSSWTSNVTWLNPTEVKSVHSEGGGVQTQLNDGSTLYVDEVIVDIFPEPRDGIADSLGCVRSDDGRIAVNEKGLTSINDVYAAGDQSTQLAQVHTAVFTLLILLLLQ